MGAVQAFGLGCARNVVGLMLAGHDISAGFRDAGIERPGFGGLAHMGGGQAQRRDDGESCFHWIFFIP